MRRLVRLLATPLRRYFSPRFDALASRLDRIETALEVLRTAGDGETDAEPEPAHDPTPIDFESFDELLHHLRGVEMSRMPRVEGTLLSAGCAGSYYFEWVAECYGPVAKHIGLELYLPKPDDLPPWVQWVKSSVSQMDGVPDRSVDLVFSGQNFEHLFGDDATDFLLECHRVISDEGWLVMDSPQRSIASALNWTMPEHTIEFDSAEAIELVQLAGFDVTAVRGVWLCQEPDSGQLLSLWPAPDSEPLDAPELVRRAVLASGRPDLSFVWWLEARRADREPRVQELRRRHAAIFATAWPERASRTRHAVGHREGEGEESIVRVDKGVAGHALFGPYMPLCAGEYQVTFRLRLNGAPLDAGAVVATLDICDVAGEVLAERSLLSSECPDGKWHEVTIGFSLDELIWGAQFRVVTLGACAVDVRSEVSLDERGTGVAPRKAG